jgi:hypothetical protein
MIQDLVPKIKTSITNYQYSSSRLTPIINKQFTIIRDNEGVYAAEKTYISRPDFISPDR